MMGRELRAEPPREKQAASDALDDMLRAYAAAPSEALRNRIVEANLYISRIIAMRFSGKGVDYDDLYQVASLALIKAVERFDPEKGVKFVSFATPSMVGEVKNYFRDRVNAITISRKTAALLKKLSRLRAQLEQTLMRAPTADELAQAADVPVEEALEALAMRGAMRPASLDNASEEDDAPSIGDFVGDEDSAFLRFENRQSMRSALTRLDDTARKILVDRYFGERSQREIAEEMGVSQMTVSRVERRALKQLRSMLTEGEE